LRSLQSRKELEGLLSAVLSARDGLNLEKKTPVLLKIAPDLSKEELSDIADAVLSIPEVIVKKSYFH
jgi:dihydroorotate dehydrogenase